jgi:hypothetical protein
MLIPPFESADGQVRFVKPHSNHNNSFGINQFGDGCSPKKGLRFARVSRMIFSMTVCHFCSKPVAIEGKIRRTEVCPGCGEDLHSCKNCRFYDPAAHNHCRETQAEWVARKDKANFCDYFDFGDRPAPPSGSSPEEIRRKMDDLFKKTR